MEALIRWYGRLLWLLPGQFRRHYAEPMRQTFADLCAATVRRRGAWALAPVCAHALADLAGGGSREWVGTLFARGRWHRTVAGGLSLLAAVLVLYSQVRYPTELARVDYVAQDLLLFNVLLAVAGGFARTTARTVVTALAALPGWVLAFSGVPVVAAIGLGLVAAVIVVAAVRDTHRWAGLAAGALSGVVVLAVELALALSNPTDGKYWTDFVHSGQSDYPAYVIGARINSGALLLFACAAFGSLTSVVVRCARAPWWRR